MSKSILFGLTCLIACAPLNVVHAQQTSCNKTTFAIQPLRIALITTGGTAVNALNAGDAVCGGFIVAPAQTICVNQNGAAGTATNGDTACVIANQPYYLSPSAKAVSVNGLVSSTVLGGYGYH